MMFMPVIDMPKVSAMQPKVPNSSARRPSSGPKTLSEIAPVAALMERARALMDLDVRLRLSLPESLRRHCCLADARSGRIVFLANSSTWAAKLRLHQSTILAEARRVPGLEVKSFTVKVAPLPSVPPEPARRKPLSRTAAKHLETAARSLTDPELRALFQNLASLAETSDSNSDKL
jgi:hypothetical protein